MLSPSPPKVHCRDITDADLSGVIDLFVRGYPYRPRQFWVRAFDRLARHPTPAGYPKYGYLMECGGVLAGAVLFIFTEMPTESGSTIRCGGGGWCVEPAFRGYAQFLAYHALRHQDVTYMTPAGPEIVRVLERLGYTRYSNGQFVAVPALSLMAGGARAKVVDANTQPNAHYEFFERDLLLAHAQYGCISLWCITAERAYPFVFRLRIVKGFIPCARLIYCRSIEDFVRFARPLGWYLALRGKPVVLLDANGPIPGLVGRYIEGSRPKYFKGPIRPRLGDLAYTQLAMFETEGPGAD